MEVEEHLKTSKDIGRYWKTLEDTGRHPKTSDAICGGQTRQDAGEADVSEAVPNLEKDTVV